MADGKMYWNENNLVWKMDCECGYVLEFGIPLNPDNAVDSFQDNHPLSQCPARSK